MGFLTDDMRQGVEASHELLDSPFSVAYCHSVARSHHLDAASTSDYGHGIGSFGVSSLRRLINGMRCRTMCQSLRLLYASFLRLTCIMVVY